jgi:hypothetical protein
LGSGFSKVNRIFTARSTSEPNHFPLYYLHVNQERARLIPFSLILRRYR